MATLPIHERRKHFRIEDNLQLIHHEIRPEELAQWLSDSAVDSSDDLMLICCPEGIWANDLLALGQQRLCGKPWAAHAGTSQNVSLSVGGIGFDVAQPVLPGAHLVLILKWPESNVRLVALASVVACDLQSVPPTYKLRARFDAMSESDHAWLQQHVDQGLGNTISCRGITLPSENKSEHRSGKH